MVLYLGLRKALYGCLKSTLLWYELFANTLKDFESELNPYGYCVVNNHINVSQCTIVWYVYDLKIPHRDPDVVTQMIKTIEKRFVKLSVRWGNKHEYMGMIIRFPGDGTVQILMAHYINEALLAFKDNEMEITVDTTTPTTKMLFELDNTSNPINEARA